MIKKQTLVNNKFKDGVVVEHLNLDVISNGEVYITHNNNKIVLDYDQVKSINKVINKNIKEWKRKRN